MGLNKTEIYEAPDVALSNCISLGEAVDYFFADLKATPLLLATPFIHKKCALSWKIPLTSMWEEKACWAKFQILSNSWAHIIQSMWPKFKLTKQTNYPRKLELFIEPPMFNVVLGNSFIDELKYFTNIRIPITNNKG